MAVSLALGCMSFGDQSLIIYYKFFKSHEMGVGEYIMIGVVVLGYNIVVKSLIPD